MKHSTVTRRSSSSDFHYILGFRVCAMEIRDGVASFVTAAERGLLAGEAGMQTRWDAGYRDCVCAHRLGHDVGWMVSAGLFVPSVVPTADIVSGLLDGTWGEDVRPDPRR